MILLKKIIDNNVPKVDISCCLKNSKLGIELIFFYDSKICDCDCNNFIVSIVVQNRLIH